MIYMVEMDFPHPERLAEWHAWYLAHIRVLQTVPGFRASQRFQAITPTPSPYLALHEVASPAIFESPEYRARGGPASTGEWRALQTNWHRNLLDGLDETPEVPDDKFLVVLRNARDAGLPGGRPDFVAARGRARRHGGRMRDRHRRRPRAARRDRGPRRAGGGVPADQRKDPRRRVLTPVNANSCSPMTTRGGRRAFDRTGAKEPQMEPSLHIVCPHCDTINRVPRAKLDNPESRRRPLRPMP